MEPMNAEKASRFLKPENTRYRNSFWKSWEDLIRYYRDGDPEFSEYIGEVRDSSDWKKLPKGEPTRIAFVPDDRGGVIRWVRQDKMGEILGGEFHQEFLFVDDPKDGIRTGYAYISSEGELTGLD